MNSKAPYYITKIVSKILLFLSASIVLQNLLICQYDANLQFKRITANDGLSHHWIRSIVQDKEGFIWICTDDGLNRYDGYTFKIYKYSARDVNTLNSSSILKAVVDQKGNLWVITRYGLNLYDKYHDRFIRHPQFDGLVLMGIDVDNKGNLWIVSTTHLYNYIPEKDSLVTYSYELLKIDTRLLRGITVFVDSKSNIWLPTTNGLYYFNNERKQSLRYVHDEKDPATLSSNEVRVVYEDSFGRIWVGTSAGLDLFYNANSNDKEKYFIRHKHHPSKEGTLSAGTVLCLLEDKSKRLWIGTENGGLSLLDLKTYKEGQGTFVRYISHPDVPTSLSSNSIYSVFEDRQGNIWVGTFGGGICFTSTFMKPFEHIKKQIGVKNSLSNNEVNVLLEDGDYLWIGTEGGLNKWDRKKGIFKHYNHNPYDATSIGSDAVWALYKDKHGTLWVGTWGGGLNKYNDKKDCFERYTHKPNDNTSIGSNNIFSIFEDSDGNFWIGTMGGGLNLFDRTKGTFKRYDISNSGIYTNYVSAIIEDTKGELWLANEVVVERFRVKENIFEHFVHKRDDTTSLSSTKIISIFKDSKKNIWIGTDAGLNLYQRETNNFKVYNTQDGLPDNFISSIIEDDKGDLWLGTNKGISRFVEGITRPQRPVFKNYTYEDGLQGNSFNRRSVLKGRDGKLYFGGSNGLNIFHPDQLTDNTYIPPIVITEFKVFNQPVPVSRNQISLSYKQSAFTISYSALNYIASQKNQYAYKLEGFDKDWNYVGSLRTATYTNLNPGDYIFRVKGSNNDGIWNEEGIALYITITPPFWQTVWFRLSLLIMLGIIGYLFLRYQKNKMKREEERKLAEAVAETVAKERNLLRTLIDNIPAHIYIKDTNGRFVIANKALLNTLGLANEQLLIGKTNEELYPHEVMDKINQSEKEVLSSGNARYDIEEPSFYKNGTGEVRWISSTKIPLTNKNNEIIGLVVVERDITEQKNSEAERERLIAELKQALADVKMLSGLIPICSNCKKIRNDQGYWIQLETFIQEHSETKFTHGICPECAQQLYPDFTINKENQRR